jgi:flagellar motor switch protein FliN/FliY
MSEEVTGLDVDHIGRLLERDMSEDGGVRAVLPAGARADAEPAIDSHEPEPLQLAPFELAELSGQQDQAERKEAASLDRLRDIELDLKIVLGRTQLHLEEVLKLRQGAVVPLDRPIGDPVDVYANGRLIARGEVLVLEDNFCVRVTELIADEAVN